MRQHERFEFAAEPTGWHSPMSWVDHMIKKFTTEVTEGSLDAPSFTDQPDAPAYWKAGASGRAVNGLISKPLSLDHGCFALRFHDFVFVTIFRVHVSRDLGASHDF